MAWGLETNIRGPAGAASTVPGPQGNPGPGVAPGGTTGQVLTKTSATDYATNWQTPSGGAGVTDGDKGDIVVSGTGATWLFDSTVVTTAAKTVLDDATTAAMLTTLGGQPLDATLTALAGLSATTGFVNQSGTDVFGKRQLAGTTNRITITNPTGSGGNPVWDIDPAYDAIIAAKVTSVTGTAPVVSSGGTAPAVSMAAATTSVNGYLTSTDWNTFNDKAPLASPTFTGDPKAPTPNPGDNDTSIATTAFVVAAIAALGGGASVTISDTAPGSPSVGALWFESDTGFLFIYYNDGTSSQWVPATVGPAGPVGAPGATGPAGADGATIPPATVAPLMDGVAAVGTTTKYAREDHRHPTDTTLAPKASPTFTDGTLNKFQINATGIGFFAATPVARGAIAVPTGTIQRTTYATASVTLPQLAGVVMAIITDLRAYGLAS